MENYFNYFTEIEEYFWKKRGTAMLVSTLDWALIDSWKEAQIPLETVLKGIDRALEKHEGRKRSPRTVNSLAYCHQAVLKAARDRHRSVPQHPSSGDPYSREDLAKYFRENALSLERASSTFEQQAKPESAATFRSIAASLAAMADFAPSGAPLDLEDMERRLTVLEDKMFATLLAAAGEPEMLAFRSEMDRELAPVRQKMGSEQIALLQKQFLQRRLLLQSDLPRLSLFYL